MNLYYICIVATKQRFFSPFTFFVMSASLSPASFPASRKGYNAYLRANGFSVKTGDINLFAMSFGQFCRLERSSLEDKIKEAAQKAEQCFRVFEDSAEGSADRSLSLDGWDFWSNKFFSLVREKNQL